MRKPGRQLGVARIPRWLFLAVGAVSICTVLWLSRATTAPDSSPAQAVDATRAALRPAFASSGVPGTGALAADALPASLDGSTSPRLPTDGRGHLARTRAVRDFFDYFLTAQNEVSVAALDALVRRQIAAQLDGTPAAGEALDVWQRYTAYRIALAQLPPPSSAQEGGAKLDLDALRAGFDERDALSARLMGEWSEPFFGAESQQQRADLARLRIATDSSLSETQKTARLAALDVAQPPEVRAARERIRQQQAALDVIDQARDNAKKQGGSLDALRAQITQTLGPEAAQRVVQMQQSDDAWQARYADYSAQRAQIDSRDLPAQQRDAQIAQLRQQFFTNPGEATRAASLDRGSGN